MWKPLLLTSALTFSGLAFGSSAGVVGYSGSPGSTPSCNGCHSGGGTPNVQLTGPATLVAGATGNYQVVISGGAGSRAGVDIATDTQFAALNPVSNNLLSTFGELTQNGPTPFQGGQVVYQFSMTAPAFAGTVNLYAAGNSCDGNGGVGGDRSALAQLAVTVTAGSGTNPPVVTAPASAPSTVVTRAADVSVAANDDGGEANLAYTWSATGPAAVSFTPNGSNAAKQSSAGFVKAGDYVLTVTVRDGTNRTVTSTVNVTVEPSYSVLRVTPATVSVPPGQKQQFQASARDQFEGALPTQPTINWSVPFGGSINASGLFTAQGSPGGPFVVVANANGISGGATVAVGGPLPESSDQVGPEVALVSPAPGETLEAGLALEAQAFDDVGVASVQFEVAGVVVANLTASPWKTTFTQASGPIPSGPQPLQAVAVDLSGNKTVSSAVIVEVPEALSASSDAGTGGLPDGGSSGGTSDGGVGPSGDSPQGCSCDGAAGSSWPWAVVALVALARRRKQLALK